MHMDDVLVTAKQFLLKEYNLPLEIPIRISNRMKTKLGAFVTKNKMPYEIVLSNNLLTHYKREEVIDVLKHECVHYALCVLKLPFKDGQAKFESELKRLHISSTYTYQYRGVVHLYTCKKCGIVFHKRMKGYEKRYRCGRCYKKFVYIGEKQIK